MSDDSNNHKEAGLPCVNDPEECGSSDALAEYHNGGAYCFSCERTWNPQQYARDRERYIEEHGLH